MDPESRKRIYALFYEAAEKYSEMVQELSKLVTETLQEIWPNLKQFLSVVQDTLKNIDVSKRPYSRAPKVIKPSKLYLEDKRNRLFYCRNNC